MASTPESEATYRGMPDGEPIPGKTYRADGWSYFDLPGKATPKMWNYLLGIIGKVDEDYIILIESEGDSKNGPWKRGQLLISPKGMENVRNHVLSKSQ